MHNMKKQALISCSDKSGVVEFAKALTELGYHILSTGGTAKLIAQAGIPVQEVADYTGFPEMLDGRVKTLNPKIHAGILARRPVAEHMEALKQFEIDPIDIVAVNLYPFEQAIANPNCTFENAIENIDIGGPTMIRAAAKNHESVTVIVSPGDYRKVIEEIKEKGNVSPETRLELAKKVFVHTAHYDAMISNYLTSMKGNDVSTRTKFPESLTRQWVKVQDMRYGENPHQEAAFYRERNVAPGLLAGYHQLHGKELSYNNIADTDAALECVKEFSEPACVIVKHANPCGVAVSTSILDAYDRAYKTDPTSAFGGIIAFNRELDAETAQAIISRQFVEVIIAPSASEDALKITAAKQNVRVLTCGQWAQRVPGLDFKRVNGGLLVQDRDLGMVTEGELRVVTKRQPSEQELRDALFCWKVAKFVKSNAIVYAKENMTIGIGAGQMSRVYSAKIAGIKAGDEGLEVKGSAMASDAFFPFRDGIDAAAAVGVSCVIQPGGSIRDDEVIAAADEHGIAMIFTDMRHFRH